MSEKKKEEVTVTDETYEDSQKDNDEDDPEEAPKAASKPEAEKEAEKDKDAEKDAEKDADAGKDAEEKDADAEKDPKEKDAEKDEDEDESDELPTIEVGHDEKMDFKRDTITLKLKLSFDLEPVSSSDANGVWLTLEANPTQTARWLKQQIWFFSNDYKLMPGKQALWCKSQDDGHLEEMLDENSLSVYGVSDGSWVYVSHAHQEFKPYPKRRLMVATRVHCKQANSIPDLTKVERLLNEASKYADVVAVAVMACGDVGNKLLAEVKKIAASVPKTIVVPVHMWGYVVPALNALVHAAVESKCDLLQFQSVEVIATPRISRVLAEYLQENTLVVGAKLKGHRFKPGLQELTGLTSPWNTLAVWDVCKLAYTNFLGISDGGVPGIKGGVEEVAAITLRQALHPKTSAAKLILLPHQMGLVWDTAFVDDAREEHHSRKMASKLSRAEAQLKALGLASGVVRHLEYVLPDGEKDDAEPTDRKASKNEPKEKEKEKSGGGDDDDGAHSADAAGNTNTNAGHCNGNNGNTTGEEEGGSPDKKAVV